MEDKIYFPSNYVTLMFWCFNTHLILNQSFLLGRYTSTTIVLSPLCPSRMFWCFM